MYPFYSHHVNSDQLKDKKKKGFMVVMMMIEMIDIMDMSIK